MPIFDVGNVAASWLQPDAEQLATLPPLDVEPPLEEWSTASFRDPWMARQLKEERLRGDISPSERSYRQFAAAGMFLQGYEGHLKHPAILRDALGSDEGLSWAPRDWVKSVEKDRLRGLTDWVRWHIAATLKSLRQVVVALQFDEDPEWWARYAQVCRERERIAGAMLLLSHVGLFHLLDRLCAELDKLGSEFDATLPKSFGVRDELLRRASLADVQAWWAQRAAIGDILPAAIDDDDLEPQED